MTSRTPAFDDVEAPTLRSELRNIGRAVVQPIVTIGLALLLGLVVVIAIGGDPIAAYSNFLFGSFANTVNFGNLLAKSTPLLFTGLGVVVAFRAGLFNIGGEGQMYVGAFFGAVVGFTLTGLPGPILVLCIIVVAAIVGGLLSALPGWLKAYFAVDEVVTSLLLNYVAILFTEYLVLNPFKDVTAGGPATVKIATKAWLPVIVPDSTATVGLLIALVMVVATWFLLFRTVWGANMRAVGTNRRFAETMGINVKRTIVQAMFVSGALAGIGGAIEVMGVEHRFYQGFSPGFGFLGLTVALLAKLNPWGTLAMALLYAGLLNGAAVMQINTSVPYPLVNLLAGIVVLIMTAQIRLRPAWLSRILPRRIEP